MSLSNGWKMVNKKYAENLTYFFICIYINIWLEGFVQGESKGYLIVRQLGLRED